MYRFVIEKLKKWKESEGRKPLILQGARQVGKTWLLKEFGQTCFDNYIYINCENNDKVAQIVKLNIEPKRIILQLQALFGIQIKPHRTLLIFDEIQEIPRLLTSLKYFAEETPEYAVCCAGSLLGIALHPGTSFPVGKVDFISLFPLNFKEFLIANGEENLVEYIKDTENLEFLNAFEGKLNEYLKYYFITGGMPECVNDWIKKHDFQSVRKIQQSIINSYENDFSKHAPNLLVPKIRYVWESIPTQLAKENKKFVYGLAKEGARAKDLEAAIMWLNDCCFIHQIYSITKVELPLKMYQDFKAFKLYQLDIGLFSYLADIDPALVVDEESLFKEFKGSLTEQFVLQELTANDDWKSFFYWTSGNMAEVDFLFSEGQYIIPVEAKAGTNAKAKSLRTFIEKYNTKKAIRTSLRPFRKDEMLYSIPLYLIWNWKEIIKL